MHALDRVVSRSAGALSGYRTAQRLAVEPGAGKGFPGAGCGDRAVRLGDPGAHRARGGTLFTRARVRARSGCAGSFASENHLQTHPPPIDRFRVNPGSGDCARIYDRGSYSLLFRYRNSGTVAQLGSHAGGGAKRAGPLFVLVESCTGSCDLRRESVLPSARRRAEKIDRPTITRLSASRATLVALGASFPFLPAQPFATELNQNRRDWDSCASRQKAKGRRHKAKDRNILLYFCLLLWLTCSITLRRPDRQHTK